MRFAELNLIAYGPFTDRTLRFTGPCDFHVIYGPNEAGKSTALRAVRGLLFGIDERTRDDHVHDKRALRIGAVIEYGDGERLAVVRRKGRKNTLANPDGAPVADGALARVLGGVTAELFDQMYGLDHAKLVAGGEALAGGGLADLLFGAGIGLGDLPKLLRRLREQADALFSPRATARPLARAIAACRQADKRIRDAALKPQAYADAARRRDAAAAELSAAQAARTAAARDRERARTLRRAVPLVAELREIEAELADLAGVPDVSDEAAAERRELQAALRERTRQRERFAADRERKAAERDGIAVDPAVRAEARAIAEFARRAAAVAQALADRGKLAGEVASLRRELDASLADLGQLRAAAESERFDAPAREQIRALADEFARLTERREQAARELDEARRALADTERARAELGEVVDPVPLRRAHEDALRAGDVDARIAEAERRAAETARARDRALAELPHWAGDVAALAALAVVDADTIAAFGDRFDRIAAAEQEAREAARRAREAIDEAGAELRALAADGPVPTAADVGEARARRDALWREVRAAWLDGAPAGAGGPEALAERFAAAVRDADHVADALRSDAERAGRRAALEAARAAAEVRLERAEADLAACERRRAEADAEWRALWEGLDPRPPAEMRRWLQRRAEVLAADGAARDAERALRELCDRRDALRDACAGALASAGEPVDLAGAGALDDARARVADALARAEARAQRRRELDRDLEAAARRVADAERRAADVAGAVGDWQARWAAATEAVGVDAGQKPEVVAALIDRVREVVGRRQAIDERQRRIAGIDRDARAFAAEFAVVAARVAPDLAPAPAGDGPDAADAVRAAEALRDRLDAANAAHERRDALAADLARLDASLAEVAADIAAAEARLTELRAAAGVDADDELETVERRAARKRDLERRLGEIRAALRRERADVDALVAEAAGVTEDEAVRREADADAAFERADERWQRAVDELNRIDAELRQMDGGDAAARAAEEAAVARAEVRRHAETYAQLAVAVHILEREIERYRGANQGPVLQRAGAMVGHMTRGRFAGLSVGFGADDEPVLTARRADGRELTLDALSDGTRDQVYLALRLASLERQVVDGADPLPLVCDDLLIHFDDDRARAALDLLVDLSARVQILFFTHHRRLVELAAALDRPLPAPIELA